MIRLAVMAVVVGALALPAAAQTQRSDTASAAQAIAIAGGGSGGADGRTQRIVTVPSVVPPSFYGANPCSNSASVGGAVMGFGIGGGGQWTERECRVSEWYRMLYMGGQHDLALAYVCDQVDAIRRVAAQIGQPCPQDVARHVTPPATPQQQAVTRPAYCRDGVANSECRQ